MYGAYTTPVGMPILDDWHAELPQFGAILHAVQWNESYNRAGGSIWLVRAVIDAQDWWGIRAMDNDPTGLALMQGFLAGLVPAEVLWDYCVEATWDYEEAAGVVTRRVPVKLAR